MSVAKRARSTALIVSSGLAAALLVAVGPVGASGSARTAAPAAAPQVVSTTAENCGPAVHRKADGTRWRCSFADYFGGTRLKADKWTVVTSDLADWGTRTDCFVNSKYNLAVNSGVLKLVSRRGLLPFPCGPKSRRYTATATSATVSTLGKYDQRYGRVEIRAKFPYTKQRGLQSALWMWPTDADGAMLGLSGEIDIAEWYSQYPDRVIPYLHYPTSFLSPSQATNTNCLVPNVGNWHLYVLEWTPRFISIKYDGVECLRKNSGGAPFNKHFFLSLTQALGVGKNAPTALTPLYSQMQVDYVRMWA